MTLSRRAGFETLRTVASSGMTGSYLVFGAPLSNGALLVKIQNNSTKDVTISDDGTNDKDIIPAGAFTLYDFGSDGQSSDNSERLCVAGGTQFWLKSSAGTGSVYMTVIYQTTS